MATHAREGLPVLQGLSGIWKKHLGSFEDSLVEETHPRNVVILVVGGLSIVGLLYFIPAIRRYSGFDDPVLPAAITILAGLATLVLNRLWWNRNARGVLTLVDSPLYCLAVIVMALDTISPVRYVFALFYDQICVHFGRRYSFGWPMFIVVGIVPLGVSFLAWPDAGLITLVIAGNLFFVLYSSTTGKQRELQRQKDKITSAFHVSDEVASRSMDIALASTVAEMGSFLHELRNALTPAETNLRFLAKSRDVTGDARAGVEDALRSVEKSSGLVERLMDTIKRRGELPERAFQLDEVLVGVVEKVGGTLGDRIEVVVEGNVPMFEVRGSPEHLRIVIENLVRNAREAGASSVKVSSTLDGGTRQVVMSVANDGPEITGRVREQILKAPITFGKGGTGRGFGLYISRRLVELMGGRLELARSDAEETVFEVRLPGKYRVDKASIPPVRKQDAGPE